MSSIGRLIRRIVLVYSLWFLFMYASTWKNPFALRHVLFMAYAALGITCEVRDYRNGKL